MSPALTLLAVDVTAKSTSHKSSGSPIGLLVIFAVIIAVFFFMSRGSRNRAKAAQEMKRSVTPNAQVMTTAGLYARVISVGEGDEDTITLEVAPGVHSRYARAAISRIITPGDPPVEPPVMTEYQEPEQPEPPATSGQGEPSS